MKTSQHYKTDALRDYKITGRQHSEVNRRLVIPWSRGLVVLWSCSLLCGSVLAQTWDGGGVDNNWTTVANWNPNVAPVNNGTANIVFTGITRPAPLINVAQDVSSVTFSSTTGSFSIGGTSLYLRNGVTNNTTVLQRFLNSGIALGGPQTWRNAASGQLLCSAPITCDSAWTIAVDFGSIYSLGPISGAGSLTKTGPQTLYLSGMSTYSGGTTINAGALVLGANNSLPDTGTITVAAGATLALTDPDTGGATDTIGPLAGAGSVGGADWANGTLTIGGGGGDATFSGTIFGFGNVAKTGNGTQTLSGSNTYYGGTTVNQGILRIAASERLYDGTVLTINNGSFDLQSFRETVGSLALNGGSLFGDGTLTAGAFNLASGFIYAPLSGPGGLTKDTAGTVWLGNSNTFSGVTTLNAGTLFLNSLLPLGTNTITLNGGTVRAIISIPLANAIQLNGTGTFDALDPMATNDFACTGPFGGPGTLIKEGPGSLSLTLPATLGGLQLNTGRLNVATLTLSGGSAQWPGSTFNGTLTNQAFYNLNGGDFFGAVANPGTFTQNAGNFGGFLTNQGTYTENGGTFSGTLLNRGTFNFNGGTFAGRLINYGTFVRPNTFSAGNGLANYVALNLAANQVLTLDGLGLDNEATISMANATIAGTGGLTNNGLLSGFGTIGGSGGLVNNAQWTIAGGSLEFNNTGPNLNFGNIDLATGLALRLNGGALNNGGSLNLNGGVVGGTADLNNVSGGMVVGPGTITCPFSNAGMLLLGSYTLSLVPTMQSPTLINSGTIQLSATGAGLSGRQIQNSGTIQGIGTIGNNLINDGDIEAIGGTLNLSGPVINNAGGLMSALSGGKLLLSMSTANSGVISLSAGTFDNNARTLNNLGEISGYGTLRSGNLDNNGTITLSGGFSTINGPVVNQAGHRINVSYNPALFTGNVINNGTFKVTSTTVQFAGSYTENGAFLSDPATNSFGNLNIGPNGYLFGGLGDHFVVSGNLQNASSRSTAWNTLEAELFFKGSPAHNFFLPGADLGPRMTGYSNNFAWGTVRLAAGEALRLQNGSSGTGAALYTRSFLLEGGLAQISAITGNGFNIYYDPSAPDNGYLGGASYPLTEGGELRPLVRELSITSIRRTGSATRLDCIGLPGQSHTVQASTNLLDWVPVGTATAAADGTFTFNDPFSAGPTRFYRLRTP